MKDKNQRDETRIKVLLGYSNSIIATLREPFLVIDKKLRVISANHAFYTIFEVAEKDTIGQLLPDLGNSQWNIPKLIQLLKEIIPEKKVVKDYEVEHKFEQIGERVMLMNACQLHVPKKIAQIIAAGIREEEKEEELILLAIEDITRRREIENGLEKARKELEATKISEDAAREYAESVIDTVREPLIALDQDLRVVSVSRSFYEFFKVKPKETVGQLIYDLGNKQWDIPKLRELLETILPQKTTFDNYEVEHDFTTIGRRVMLLNARQIQRVLGKERIILLAIEDITERKRAGKMLQESREMSHVLFISSREAIMTLEPPSWKFTSCNPATVQMFKVKDEAEFISYEPWVLSPERQPDRRASDEKAKEMIEMAMREGFHFFEWTHKRLNGEEFLVEVFLTKVEMGGKVFLQANFRDITKRKQAEMALRNIEWMLTKSTLSKFLIKKESQQPYGDLTKCNTSRLILDSVGDGMLSDIADDYLDLMDTCTAIYEKNGDYAFSIFTSDWCKFMDEAGRNLCGTQDNKEALSSGKWICHESCWNEASKVSIENGQPTDIKCKGGIHIYAVPVHSGKEIVGSINFGYGDLPKDPQKIKELASLYGVKEEKLFELANSYQTRPPYIIDIAKKRLLVSAKLIGDLVEHKKMEEEMQKRLHELEVFYKASVGREERILELKKENEQLKKELGK